MSTELLVAHTNGQEIIGEKDQEASNVESIILKRTFVINREHMAVGETIGTMLLLDPLGDGSQSVKKSLCSLVRTPTDDEEKSYNRIRMQMSNLVQPTAGDLKLVNK